MFSRLRSKVQEYGKETCPYCFERFSMKETPFRCSSPAKICSRGVDPVLDREWGDTRPQGRVLTVASGSVSEMKCDKCGQTSRLRLCPHCHQALPMTFGKYRNYIFAVVGGKEAGKTHYLAVLVNQLKNVIGPNYNLLLEPLDDDTINRYRKDFYAPLYENHHVLDFTSSALTDARVKRPMVYNLLFTEERHTGGGRIRKAVTLAFFDTAGEDLNDQDTMSAVNKYIFRSDGIVLLIDPLQMPGLRGQLPSQSGLPPIHADFSDLISRITNLIMKGRNLSPSTMIDIPLAVAVSKFDALDDVVDESLAVQGPPMLDEGFDPDDLAAVNGEVQSLLAAWGGKDIINRINSRYSRVGYFGISSLGSAPDPTGRVPAILPRRVEDPFLWLLVQQKLL